MSLILFMKTGKDLLLAGDSRLTQENDNSWHRDDCYKVFKCNDIIGITFHETANINDFVTNGNIQVTVQVSVGGPIDILMITRNGTNWIRKK